MVQGQVRNRHRLKKKKIVQLENELNSIFSIDFGLINKNIDSAEVEHDDVYILNNEIIAKCFSEGLFLTIRGLLRFGPDRRFVTVDMGAVRFVTNGADIMAPGIVDADLTIKSDELVWIRDEKNLRPLAIGQSLMNGSEMVQSNSAKAIRSLHYIGDKFWKIEL
jgi:PUA domain protein